MKTKKKMHFAHWGFAMLLAFSMATSVFAKVEPTFAITEQPTAITVVEKDSSVTLSFVAQMGNEKVSYQWYSSADGSTNNAVALKGADESSFKTGAISEKGVRYYFCVASVGEKSVTSDVAAVAYTGLPVLYVNTPKGVEITSKEDWTKKTTLTLTDAENPKWNFKDDTTSIRGRGNSTWLEPKKPYALKLNNKTEIMGMPKHKRWVLIANYLDNSFLKNHMAFYLSNMLEMDYTVRGKFVNLVFNGVYRGLYWLGEAIKVDKKRVNIYDGEDGMADTDDKDLLIEMDSHYDEVVKFTTPIRKMPYMIKNDDYFYDEDNNNEMTSGGTARLARFQDKIAALENLLYPDYNTNNDCKVNTNYCSAPDEAYKGIIDVESWAKFWLINEIMDNTELTEPKSAYFTYQNKKEGQESDVFKAGPVWDFDAGAKTLNAPIKLDTTIYYNALFKSPSFVAKVKEVWANFATMTNIISVYNEIQKMTIDLAVAAKLDSMRWGAHRDYVETTDLSFSGNVEFLKNSLQNKVQVVDNFITKLVDLSTLTDDYEAKDGDILTGTLGGDYKISIEDGASVTLKNATIQGSQDGAGEWAGITCNGDCNIMLEGVNTVMGFHYNYPGIYVPEEKTLTIDGSGKLSASTVSNEKGWRYAAGIGGGADMSCGNIVIKNGIINATSGVGGGGAGIGAGVVFDGNYTCGNITISGGTVTATVGENGIGAAIGTGYNSGSITMGNITISGGTVSATVGEFVRGAGIGSGYNSGSITMGDITISGGSVSATVSGGDGAAGIAGIGTGFNDNGSIVMSGITISGGSVTATGYDGAGIGIGWNSYSGDITLGDIVISGGTVVASGEYDGAGIGTGFFSVGHVTFGNITISGGTVVAKASNGGAGIGVGYYENGSITFGDITITNGVKKVTVTKGDGSMGYDYSALHSIGIGFAESEDGNIIGPNIEFGKITVGDKETGFISESPFVYPTPIADFAAVQIYKYDNNITRAELDGNYTGEGEASAINITDEVDVDEVEFNRTFPKNTYSTIVLPFNVNTANVSGLDAVLRYNGIGKDKDGNDAIRMKVVWATKKWVEDNDIRNDKNELVQYAPVNMEANTPYLIRMGDDTFKVKGGVTIVPTDEAVTKFDEWEWEFRGTWEYKKWNAGDKELGYAYGFAATPSDESNIKVGDFVKVGEGAWISPMRAYLVSNNIPVQAIRANGNYVMRPSAVRKELPELMSVIIGGDEDSSEEQTTVIGHFNTRTGEFKMNRNRNAGARTFDLKGRYVGDKANRARGAYYGKKVLK